MVSLAAVAEEAAVAAGNPPKTDSSMDESTKALYQKLVSLYTAAGMTPSSAKVFVWLMICEPAIQTAESIRQATHVSAGGLSEAITLLTKTELVRRHLQPGERKHYYELEKNGFLQSIKQRAIVAGISRDIAYEGLKVLPGNDRLKALGDAYGFLADQLPRLIDKYTKSHL